MRVVFDSNVWIAALAASGTSHDVVQDAVICCELFISPYILQEVDQALARKLGATREERAWVRRWLMAVCQVVDPPPQEGVTSPDPDDLPILWLALAVHADRLITGDHALLRLNEIRGITIIPPGRFWEALP